MVLVAIVVVTLAAAITSFLGSLAVRATRSPVISAIVIAVVALVLVSAPLALEWLLAEFFKRPHVRFYDLRFLFLLPPGAVALLAAWPLVRRHTAGHAGIAVGLWGWVAFDGVFNTVNKCTPGWCASYGFPLRFYSWTDAILSFNGWSPAPFQPAALVIDVLVFLVPFLMVLRRAARRARPPVGRATA